MEECKIENISTKIAPKSVKYDHISFTKTTE